MTRNEVIVGSMIGVLAVAGIGQIYFDKGALRQPQKPAVSPEPATEETRPVTIHEVVSNFLPNLEQGLDEQKRLALGGLLDQLESPEYAKAAVPEDLAQPLAAAAASIVSVSTDAAELAGLRRRAAYMIAGRTQSQASKAFVLEQLVQGSDEVRAEILRGLARPGGVLGRDVFAAVKDVGEKGAFPPSVVAPALRRLGGLKSVEPVVAMMGKTSDWKEVGACVTALQDLQEPSVLGPALERLDALGLLEKGPMLPWISPKLFGKHIDQAQGAALARGLKAAKTRPSLVKVSLEAVKRGLESQDNETRRVAAETVRKAVLGRVIQTKAGQTMLAARLDRETEPEIKAQLTGGLKELEQLPAEEGTPTQQ